MVLIHGIGSRWQVFEPIIDLLALHHDVISVDLPGFGASSPDRTLIASPAGYAQRMAEFFDELGIFRPHVVGSSMGGGIALELGRMGIAGQVTAFAPVGFWPAPGRIWCQTMLSTMRWVSAYARPLVERMYRTQSGRAILLSGFYGHPVLVSADVAIADVRALVGATMFAEARREFARYRVVPDQAGLEGIPVTIAWGTRDRVLWHHTQSRRARRNFPHVRHLVLRDCGHLPFNDNPELCARVVLGAQTTN
jgi:pimeloyl-ACP methyl ester carboxylesterase